MYQAIAYFNFENFEEDPVTLIGQVVNQWRYNGPSRSFPSSSFTSRTREFVT